MRPHNPQPDAQPNACISRGRPVDSLAHFAVDQDALSGGHFARHGLRLPEPLSVPVDSDQAPQAAKQQRPGVPHRPLAKFNDARDPNWAAGAPAGILRLVSRRFHARVLVALYLRALFQHIGDPPRCEYQGKCFSRGVQGQCCIPRRVRLARPRHGPVGDCYSGVDLYAAASRFCGARYAVFTAVERHNDWTNAQHRWRRPASGLRVRIHLYLHRHAAQCKPQAVRAAGRGLSRGNCPRRARNCDFNHQDSGWGSEHAATGGRLQHCTVGGNGHPAQPELVDRVAAHVQVVDLTCAAWYHLKARLRGPWAGAWRPRRGRFVHV